MTFFLLFIRYLPVLAIAELKAIMPAADPHGHGHSYNEMTSETDEQAKIAEEEV
jgi:molybdopterin-containing oxidoreductase family membrane subunit